MIVIKNMNMPKCCGECEVCDIDEIGCFCPLLDLFEMEVDNYMEEEKGRHPSCPLEEV